MNSTFFIKSLVFSLFFGLFACDSKNITRIAHDIPSGVWTYANALQCPFSIQDTAVLYNISIEVEHDQTFQSQNLYTRLSTQFPDGKKLYKNFSLDFYDSKGSCFGACSGKKCTVTIPIQEKAFFNKAGNYVISMEQFMRSDSIAGVHKVALLVEKTAEVRK